MSESAEQPGLFDGRPDPANDEVTVELPGDSDLAATPSDADVVPAPELPQALRGWLLPTNRHNLTKMLAVRALLPYEAFADKYYDDLLRLCPGRIPLVEGGVPSSLLVVVAPDENDIPVLLEIEMPGGSAAPEGAPAWAPAGPLPISWLTAIHFRSEVDRAEYLQNEYADVRPVPELCRVSPERFAITGDGDLISSYLESLEAPSGEFNFTSQDRRGGAALLAFTVADADAARTVADGLDGRHDDAPRPLAGLGAWLAGAEPSLRSPEALVAYRAFVALSAVDRRREWRVGPLLKDLAGELMAGLPEEAGLAVRANLERTAAILRSEQVFDGFTDDEWPILKALQLVLRFPDHDRMNITEAELPGLDRATRVLAAAMLGSLTGRSRLPVLARPHLLDDAIATWECARLRLNDEPRVSAPVLAVEVEPAGAWISADGARVLGLAPQDAPPVDYGEVLANLLATDQGRKAALAVARDLGWLDLVITTIRAGQASAADLRVRPADDRADVVLRIRGEVDVNVDVDGPMFIERALQTSDLPALIRRLQEAEPAPKKSRPKRAKVPPVTSEGSVA